jgi:hypothetical protein
MVARIAAMPARPAPAASCVVGLIVLFTSAARATPSPLFHAVRIADTNTPIPGATGNFTGFGIPSSTSFAASGAGVAGVYRFRGMFDFPIANPTILKLADTNTLVPGGVGSFTGFDTPSYDFYFHATGAQGQEGIYRGNVGSTPSRYVDTNTPIPGGTGTFTAFHPHASFGVYYGEGTAAQKGIYRASSVLVNTTTQLPGQPGTFFNVFGSITSNEYSIVRFHAGAQAADAVYTSQFGTVSPAADSGSHIDSSAATLGQVYALGTGHAISGFGVLAEPDRGVYYIGSFSGAARTVATATQIRPDSPSPFGNITDVLSGEGSIESGPTVAFRTLDGDRSEIYFSAIASAYGFPKGVLPVIGTGDVLDGRQVAGVALGDDGLDRYTVTFRADFTDGSSGIYTSYALEPEPSALLPAAVVLLTLRRSHRRPSFRTR